MYLLIAFILTVSRQAFAACITNISSTGTGSILSWVRNKTAVRYLDNDGYMYTANYDGETWLSKTTRSEEKMFPKNLPILLDSTENFIFFKVDSYTLRRYTRQEFEDFEAGHPEQEINIDAINVDGVIYNNSAAYSVVEIDADRFIVDYGNHRVLVNFSNNQTIFSNNNRQLPYQKNTVYAVCRGSGNTEGDYKVIRDWRICSNHSTKVCGADLSTVSGFNKINAELLNEVPKYCTTETNSGIIVVSSNKTSLWIVRAADTSSLYINTTISSTDHKIILDIDNTYKVIVNKNLLIPRFDEGFIQVIGPTGLSDIDIKFLVNGYSGSYVSKCNILVEEPNISFNVKSKICFGRDFYSSRSKIPLDFYTSPGLIGLKSSSIEANMNLTYFDPINGRFVNKSGTIQPFSLGSGLASDYYIEYGYHNYSRVHKGTKEKVLIGGEQVCGSKVDSSTFEFTNDPETFYVYYKDEILDEAYLANLTLPNLCPDQTKIRIPVNSDYICFLNTECRVMQMRNETNFEVLLVSTNRSILFVKKDENYQFSFTPGTYSELNEEKMREGYIYPFKRLRYSLIEGTFSVAMLDFLTISIFEYVPSNNSIIANTLRLPFELDYYDFRREEIQLSKFPGFYGYWSVLGSTVFMFPQDFDSDKIVRFELGAEDKYGESLIVPNPNNQSLWIIDRLYAIYRLDIAKDDCCDSACQNGCYGPNISMCYDRCPEKQFNGLLGECYSCAESCLICFDAKKCLVCDVNMLLEEGRCQEACSTGYYNDGNKTCQPCDLKCQECNGAGSSNCTKCDSQKYLENSRCQEVCSTGYYNDGNKTCQPCDLKCQECNGAGSSNCTKCPEDKPKFLNTCKDNCTSPMILSKDLNACVCPELFEMTLEGCIFPQSKWFGMINTTGLIYIESSKSIRVNFNASINYIDVRNELTFNISENGISKNLPPIDYTVSEEGFTATFEFSRSYTNATISIEPKNESRLSQIVVNKKSNDSAFIDFPINIHGISFYTTKLDAMLNSSKVYTDSTSRTVTIGIVIVNYPVLISLLGSLQSLKFLRLVNTKMPENVIMILAPVAKEITTVGSSFFTTYKIENTDYDCGIHPKFQSNNFKCLMMQNLGSESAQLLALLILFGVSSALKWLLLTEKERENKDVNSKGKRILVFILNIFSEGKIMIYLKGIQNSATISMIFSVRSLIHGSSDEITLSIVITIIFTILYIYQAIYLFLCSYAYLNERASMSAKTKEEHQIFFSNVMDFYKDIKEEEGYHYFILGDLIKDFLTPIVVLLAVEYPLIQLAAIGIPSIIRGILTIICRQFKSKKDNIYQSTLDLIYGVTVLICFLMHVVNPTSENIRYIYFGLPIMILIILYFILLMIKMIEKIVSPIWKSFSKNVKKIEPIKEESANDSTAEPFEAAQSQGGNPAPTPVIQKSVSPTRNQNAIEPFGIRRGNNSRMVPRRIMIRNQRTAQKPQIK